MKRIMWSVVLALILCAGLAIGAIPGQRTLSPGIAFSEELWDFGTIRQGDVVTHMFEVRNTGEAELVISKVRTSCGCTAALLSLPEIVPGGSSKIKVTFDSSGFRGKVSNYIYVESNDPDEPLRKLTITANVEVPPQPTIELAENSWDFGLITEGERPTYILSVKNIGERELLITEIETWSPHCTTKLLSAKNIPPGKMGRISISYDSTGQKGIMEDFLYINSNDPSRKTIVFPLTGYIIKSKPELSISPIFFNLGTIKQDGKYTMTIRLKNWGEKRIQIVNINGSSELIILTPSSIQIDPGEEARIDVSLNPGEETGLMEEYLYLTIVLPIEAVIEER